MVAINGIGFYVPRFRVPRSAISGAWGGGGVSGENSLAGPDEDALTMAVEASERALEVAGLNGADLDGVAVATTSGPYQQHPIAVILSETLGVRPGADALDVTASTRAPLTALRTALDAVVSGRSGRVLVAGSDLQSPAPGDVLERFTGAGAGSIIVGSGPGLAEIDALEGINADFIDRWQGTGQPHIREYERRYARDQGYRRQVVAAVKLALDRLGTSIGDYRHVILPWPAPAYPALAAKALGVSRKQMSAADQLIECAGDIGTAGPLVGLVAALEDAEPGDRVLVVAYGNGGADAMSLTVNRPLRPAALAERLSAGEPVSYTRALQMRGDLARPADISSFGVPPMSPLVQRDARSLKQLIGSRCSSCGYVNFPPSLHLICIRCGATEFTPHSISRTGQVHTYCVNYYLPPPLEAPLPTIIAKLDDGVTYRALGTEMNPDDIHVDSSVELVLRVIAEERGVRLYGYKFRFARSPQGAAG